MKENQVTPTRIYIAWVLLGAIFFACVLVWQEVYAREKPGTLKVAFLDVGQGDAIFIETPHGNQVLIDGGKGRAVLRELGSMMPSFDRSIDVVVATHPDSDHIEGLPEVFARYDVGMFVEAGVGDSSVLNKTLHQAVQDEGRAILHAKRGMSILLDTDVTLKILFPDRDVRTLESNTASIVAQVTYKETTFLFTGDAPSGIEMYLTTVYGEALQSDVLKVGHHGSKTSSADEFLGYVKPTYAVLSVGCDNSYGHPHEEVLEKLKQFDVKTLNTCQNGTIVFESDGVVVSTQAL